MKSDEGVSEEDTSRSFEHFEKNARKPFRNEVEPSFVKLNEVEDAEP
ncbi:hypothetical protein HYV56_00030 [Candidatus Peregrinibacteria bacterium]|nr:hypothetical protein [Candidatus Peregrinibacteria bacterium]